MCLWLCATSVHNTIQHRTVLIISPLTSRHSGDRRENASHTAYFTTCGLTVTLTFDLNISQVHVNRLLLYDYTGVWKQNNSGIILTVSRGIKNSKKNPQTAGSVDDAHRKLVNATAVESLKGFALKLTEILPTVWPQTDEVSRSWVQRSRSEIFLPKMYFQGRSIPIERISVYFYLILIW